MIYFIRDIASGLVKIGFSEKPWDRFNKIQCDYPGHLVMWLVIEGDRATEALVQKRLSVARHRGEWYLDKGPVAAFVADAHRSGQAIEKAKSDHGQLKRIAAATGISEPYLSMLRAGQRSAPSVLAHIFTKTGVKFGPLAEFTDDEAATWARLTQAISPYAPPGLKADAA